MELLQQTQVLSKDTNLDWSNGLRFIIPLESICKGINYILFNREFDGKSYFNYQIRSAKCEELNLEEDYYRFLLLKPDLDTRLLEFIPPHYLNESKSQYSDLWFVIEQV